MIAVKISSKKDFMAKLLTTELFDNYYVEEATIETFNTFNIDGHINRDFYRNDDPEGESAVPDEYSKWSELRTLCFDLIKGKRTPLGFKFILHPDNKTKNRIVESAGAGLNPSEVLLGINIRFTGDTIIITTGTAFKIFSLDKTIEKAWDEYIPSFMSHSGIDTTDYD